ncbi:Selenocysteine insertion sequence-binding protein 2-like [Chamberlinius hualienensis]
MASEDALNSVSKTNTEVNVSSLNQLKSEEIKEYEQSFKDRYSDNDDYFQCSVSQKVRPPPVVYPWYSKARRNFDYAKVQFNRRSNRGWWTNPSHTRGQHSNRGGRRYDDDHRRTKPPNGSGLVVAGGLVCETCKHLCIQSIIFQSRMNSQPGSFKLSPLVKEFVPKSLSLAATGQENVPQQLDFFTQSSAADIRHVNTGGRKRGNWRKQGSEQYNNSPASTVEFNTESSHVRTGDLENLSKTARHSRSYPSHSQHYKINSQSSVNNVATNTVQYRQNSIITNGKGNNTSNVKTLQNTTSRNEKRYFPNRESESTESGGWIEVRSKSRRDDKEKIRQMSESTVLNAKVKSDRDETLSQKLINMSISTKENPNLTEKPKIITKNKNGQTDEMNVERVQNISKDVQQQVEKKKKKKTGAQRKEEYRSKLMRLPSTHGKVCTVSSDVFQFLSVGEQTPKLLRRTDGDEGCAIDLRKAYFPVLGEESVEPFAVDGNDSGWSDIEVTDMHTEKVVQINEEFPQLGAIAAVGSSNSKLPNYSELFKKAALSRHGQFENKISKLSPKQTIATNPSVAEKKSNPVSLSSKPKSKSLIKVDIANMMVKRQQTSEIKRSIITKEKRTSKVRRVVVNILDSSAPLRRRGKEREIPRKKRSTPMKKIILKERQERRLAKSQPNPVEENQPDKKPNDPPNQDQSILISENLLVKSDSEKSPPDLKTNIIHSRKFREYCHQNLSSEIDEVTTKLLQDLIRFHDRVYQKDPVKAKMRRRLVVGLREMTKHLKLKRLKCVILAPNLERISNQGGLDDVIDNIISLSEEMNVPVVFALSRRKLGYVCLKRVPVSGVGIFNYDGSEENYKKLIELAEKEQNSYNEKQAIVRAN